MFICKCYFCLDIISLIIIYDYYAQIRTSIFDIVIFYARSIRFHLKIPRQINGDNICIIMYDKDYLFIFGTRILLYITGLQKLSRDMEFHQREL